MKFIETTQKGMRRLEYGVDMNAGRTYWATRLLREVADALDVLYDAEKQKRKTDMQPFVIEQIIIDIPEGLAIVYINGNK